ncbi:Basement membrane-specific heparan sulfate proteoglycan core protein [Mactra antiquata]
MLECKHCHVVTPGSSEKTKDRLHLYAIQMNNTVTMLLSLFLVSQFIQFSYGDVNCLQCNDVLHPTECNTFQKCRLSERCFVEAFLTTSGEITYDLGCREVQQCDGLKPITRRHIPDGINKPLVDRYGNFITNTTRRSAQDPVICSNCCQTELCNSLGCGSNGFASFRGPICANCPKSDSVGGCNKLKVCKQHEVCMLLKSIDTTTHLPRYQTKCEQEQVCNDQFIEYSSIYAMFMGKKLDAVSEGVRCNIKCCKADLCNTECKSAIPIPQLSMRPQQSKTLPKQPEVIPVTTDITAVQPAEFVDMRNTHYPKGHPWSNENNIVTDTPTHFEPNPSQNNRLPSGGPNPQGMPSYKVSSESPAILSALGISELPKHKNTSSNADGRNRWSPASDYNPQGSQSRSNFGGPQGQQENLDITMTSSQNIDNPLSAGMQRVSDPGHANQEYQIMGADQWSNNMGSQDRHMSSQRQSHTNYPNDPQMNAEAHFLSQSQQEPAFSRNAGRDAQSNQRPMDSQRHYDPQASSNAASRNRESALPGSRYSAQQEHSNNFQRPNQTAAPATDPYGRHPSETRHFDSTRPRDTTPPMNFHNSAPNSNFDFLSPAQRKRVAEVMNSNRQANDQRPGPTSDPHNNFDRQGFRTQVQTDQFTSMNSRSGSAQSMQDASQRNRDAFNRQTDLNIQSALGSSRNEQTNAAWNGQMNTARNGQTNAARNGQMNTARNEQMNAARNGQTNAARNGQMNAARNGQTNAARNGQMNAARNEQMNAARNGQMNAARNGQMNAARNGQMNAARNEQMNAARNGQMNTGISDIPNESQERRPHVPNDPYDPSGLLNTKGNTFSKRNNVHPWGPPEQASNMASWNNHNATRQNDPRNSNSQSHLSGFNRNAPYPDLLYPSHDLASQGIKDIQRITTSPNLERYGMEYQQQQQQQAVGRNSFNGRHVEQANPVTVISAPPVFRGLNSMGSMTTVPIIDVSTVMVPSPCVQNPCVRGTCIEKAGTYSCKCQPGSWGKNCEQSLLVTTPSNITVTTKLYKVPETTQVIDPCFSNPCMRGKCEFYHKTYRCKCDYGFYGRDCEKVSLGGAAFLGAMGLNIDACQAQATPCVNGNCTTANNKVACTCEPGYTGTTCSEVLDHCSSLPCVRGTCLNGTQGFECICPPGFTGVHCESINYCATTPCRHGTCSNMADGYVCNCSPGYTGTQCEAVDHCSSSPCVRGRCTNRQTEFDCSCPAGYIGKQCEAIDFCFPSPCKHGTCINSNTGYTCSCPKGFIGQQCQVIDHCASRPCIRGDCENLETSYVCACPIGYIGKQCQTIDHCASKPCAHGRCINGDADYECRCPYGYTGKQCQTVDHCSSSPCARGKCKNTHTGFNCECPPGYTGPQCLTIDHCHTTPCARGTCLNSNTGYTCILSSGYIGSHLQGNGPAAATDHCASSPCVHGSCVSGNTGFVCQCQPGYFGARCEVYVPGKAASAAPPRLAEFHYTPPPQVAAFRQPKVIDHCASHPCQHGTCVSDRNGFKCYCPPGFKGKTCEIQDHCVPPPCKRGDCVSNTTSFQCNCPPGYNGLLCEVKDHCYPSPCAQGTCVNSNVGFVCYCPPGFTGLLCDVMDPCASSPCVQGNCHRTKTGYACECLAGYTGQHCDAAIVTTPDLCASYPCLRGTCTSSNFGFQCNCPSGYTGTYCEVDMYAMTDHCASYPCQRGTCVNTDLGYQCNCPSGYTGVQCEVRTSTATGADNICANNMCQFGTCVPGTTSYTCQCYQGYSGMNCDVPDGSYCDLNPGVFALCGHGTCRSVGSGYECICDTRYNGTHCLFQYECFGGHVCFHDGTCVNKQYCSCRSGYSGNHCGTLHSYDQIKLKPGDIVTRGRDWQYGNQDGGLHSVGKVISLTGEWVNVMWVNGEKYHYKMKPGKYDLELAP